MTYIITSLCLRDGGCVDVCPVECIVPGKPQEEWPWYYIDPEVCIDCGACLPECPVEAIVTGDDSEESWLEKNAKYDYVEEKRKTSKDDVTHGPDWDADKA